LSSWVTFERFESLGTKERTDGEAISKIALFLSIQINQQVRAARVEETYLSSVQEVKQLDSNPLPIFLSF